MEETDNGFYLILSLGIGGAVSVIVSVFWSLASLRRQVKATRSLRINRPVVNPWQDGDES